MEKNDFEIVAKRLRTKLLAIVSQFNLPSGIEPDDVVQEALLSLWRLYEAGYPIRDADALAIKIAKNISINHYRKTHIQTQSLSHDNYLGGMEATLLTDMDDLLQIRNDIYATLTPTQREFLQLRNDEGLSLDEIADVTGRPKTSIKSSISKARKQMLDLIKKQL